MLYPTRQHSYPMAALFLVSLTQGGVSCEGGGGGLAVSGGAPDSEGKYLVEVGPSFAVPGQADVQLRVTAAGPSLEFAGTTLKFSIGEPPRDTVRFDADLGVHRGSC